MALNETLAGGVSKLDAQVRKLISMMGTASAKGGFVGSAASGASNVMQASFGNMGTPANGSAFSSMQVTSMGSGLGQFTSGMGQVAQGAGQQMPDVGATIQRAGTYYGSVIRGGGGMSRPAFSKMTLAGMQGGVTSPGSDANVAAYLTQRGMMGSAEFGSTYQQTLRGVGNAAKYLNISNEEAAMAIEGMTSGRGSARTLRNFGIYTADPTTGKEKTQGQIMSEVFERFTAGQQQATEAETLQSIRRGALGASFDQMGLQGTEREMYEQYFLERSRGNDMDLSDPEAMQKLMDKAKKENNENPFLPGYSLNTTKTEAMGGAEGQYIAGMKVATEALKALAAAGGAAASAIGAPHAMGTTFMSDSIGQGVSQMIGGVGNMIGGVINFGLSLLNPFKGDTRTVGNASASGGGFGGGRGAPIGGDTGTSNASAGTSAGSTSSGAPESFRLIHPVSSPKITAVFGQKKSSYSGEIVWPNGHKGVDYAAKLGDTIYAAADGEVMPTDSGGEFGNYVKIKHANGMYTFYAHLSSKLVTQGNVKQGQPVGAAGNTGGKSFGVHLHFALSTSATTANAIDPAPYMSGAASSLGMTASNPEQSSSGAVPASSGDSSSQLGSEDTSKSSSSAVTNILSISASGYTASSSASGASLAQNVEPISAASHTAGKNAATTALNAASEGGENYVGSGESSYISSQPTGANGAATPRNGRGNGSGSVNNVTINLTIAKATDDEARRFAKMLKHGLEQETLMKNMARS